jgi:hypothetical protein
MPPKVETLSARERKRLEALGVRLASPETVERRRRLLEEINTAAEAGQSGASKTNGRSYSSPAKAGEPWGPGTPYPPRTISP